MYSAVSARSFEKDRRRIGYGQAANRMESVLADLDPAFYCAHIVQELQESLQIRLFETANVSL